MQQWVKGDSPTHHPGLYFNQLNTLLEKLFLLDRPPSAPALGPAAQLVSLALPEEELPHTQGLPLYFTFGSESSPLAAASAKDLLRQL